MTPVTRDDVVGAVVIAVGMALVAGIAALFLVGRDRFRDWRGVPEWVRKRGELRAQRVAAIYTAVVRAAFGVACVVEANRHRNSFWGILLVVPGGVALWTIQRCIAAYRQLTMSIHELEREHGGEELTADK